nr:SpoIIE family protein phosphatase [Nocardioides perillae]
MSSASESGPRVQLAQSSSRADFLSALSRSLSAVQHPARAVETVVSTLVDGAVDFAQVTIRTEQGWLAAGQTVGFEPVLSSDYHVARRQGTTIRTLMQRGIAEHWVLPPDTPERVEVLDHLFGRTDLAEQLDTLDAASLLLVPLNARGRAFGLLAVARAAGHGFDQAAVDFVEDVAQRVAVSLDACCVVAESRRVAASLRDSLEPRPVAAGAGLDVATYSRVAHEDASVGGDFVDLHGPDDDLSLLMGDVVGHGVPAAIAAQRIRNSARTITAVDRDPAQVLEVTNRVLMAESAHYAENFATAVSARLRRTGDVVHVEIAVAGHPPPLVVRTDGTVEPVAARGPALALKPDARWRTDSFELGLGDTLVCFTDGVTEARRGAEFFGDARLLEALRDLAGARPGAVVERLAMAVATFRGAHEERDDTSIVALQPVPVRSSTS